MRGIATFVPVVAVVFGVSAANARPAAAQATPLGSPVVVEGMVGMSVEDDFQSGRATRHYFLDQSGPDRRYELRLTPRQAAVVQPGMKVRVIGKLAGGILTANHADHSVVVLDTPAGAPADKSR
jgi:hypothetical protein